MSREILENDNRFFVISNINEKKPIVIISNLTRHVAAKSFRFVHRIAITTLIK